jgi:penicillin amidase
MKRFRPIRFSCWLIFSGICLYVLSNNWGTVPAIGPLLDLNVGVWSKPSSLPKKIFLSGLVASVTLVMDSEGVPHIFAKEERDLYLVQGYWTAKDRLFQMDMNQRVVTGRFSELTGAKTAGLDRHFIELGIYRAEEIMRRKLLSDPVTNQMMKSYLSGVNQWIASSSKSRPLEYKLLGTRPQKMDERLVSGIAKAMNYYLSGATRDLERTSVLRSGLVSESQMAELFPPQLIKSENSLLFPEIAADSENSFKGKIPMLNPARPWKIKNSPPGFNGSNSFLVHSSKSQPGVSLFANDTHLGYSLPNVWYEVQLRCPKFNVYGVGFPGIPGIVNGMNESISWGPTNGATDAVDFYEVEFRDSSFREYKDGDQWLASQHEEVPLPVRGEKVPRIQTVIWTKWGPVIERQENFGLVHVWTGFETGNELKALRNLYEATSAKSCGEIFQTDWLTPIQNFQCADSKNILAIHAGFIARRDANEGLTVMRPEQSLGKLKIRMNKDLQPTGMNSRRGFYHSANQRVVGSEFPNFMGAEYEDPLRAHRIEALIESDQKVSAEELVRIQQDTFDGLASHALPKLLELIRGEVKTPQELQLFQQLSSWDFHLSADSRAASFFKAWIEEIKGRLFPSWPLVPSSTILIRIFNNETFLQPQGPVLESWKAAVSKFNQDPWWKVNKTQFPHVAKIPGLGSEILNVGGGATSPFSNRGWHGPVYQFVAEMTSPPKAWIQIPGGNSGNPLDRKYGRFLEDWSKGKMRPVQFFLNEQMARQIGVEVFEFFPDEGNAK